MVSLTEFIQIQEGLFSSKPKSNYKKHGFSDNKNLDSFLSCLFSKYNPDAHEEIIEKLQRLVDEREIYDIFYVPSMSVVKDRFAETCFNDCIEQKNLSKLYEIRSGYGKPEKMVNLSFAPVKSTKSKYGTGVVCMSKGEPKVLILNNLKAYRKANGIK